jgi:uncharacterized LabA/DUF88 family protein
MDHGYTVITKPAKEFDDGEGRRRFKRNMHIEIAVNEMDLAEKVDQIVLLFRGRRFPLVSPNFLLSNR